MLMYRKFMEMIKLLDKFRKQLLDGKIEAVVSLLGHAKAAQSLLYMLMIIRDQAPLILNNVPNIYRRLLCSLTKNSNKSNFMVNY